MQASGIDLRSRSSRYHDETERRSWQNPEEILREIRLEPGQTFVDLGCGDGFFAIPAARIVGKSGRVYGLDIDPEAIHCLTKKAEKEGLTNLLLTVGRAEDVVPCIGCADFVFLGIAFHDFDDPLKVLSNVKVMLKPTGHLIDVDWEKKPMEIGPPIVIRFSRQRAISLLREAGFKSTTMKFGTYHYMIVACKL